MLQHLRRPAVLVSTSLLILIILTTAFVSQTNLSASPLVSKFTSSKTTKGLHHILPATAINQEACKLLFTGAVLGYPDPILIGWGGHGRWNGSENHLFKFPVLLEYFATLRPDQDDDLMFLLDAYDIWLQLPPEILIQRYYRAIAQENARLKRNGLLDKPSALGVPIRSSILFGSDRLCWPGAEAVPCWAAPESLLPQYAMGPATDLGDPHANGATRPRYLNSGTIIGPVKDIRALFQETYNRINSVYDSSNYQYKNSDQYYLHMMWGEQEEARLGIANGTISARGTGRTEFGVAVDGKSDAFQLTLYLEYVTWMRFNHSAPGKKQKSSVPSARLDRLNLEDPLLESPGPFSMVNDTLVETRSWKDVMLGLNVITGSVFPLLHITPQKYIRDTWWPRMWFHPHGKALLQGARKRWLDNVRNNNQLQHVVARVDGVEWIAASGSRGDASQTLKAVSGSKQNGGVWNDLGEYMLWDDMCGRHEGAVFLT